MATRLCGSSKFMEENANVLPRTIKKNKAKKKLDSRKYKIDN